MVNCLYKTHGQFKGGYCGIVKMHVPRSWCEDVCKGNWDSKSINPVLCQKLISTKSSPLKCEWAENSLLLFYFLVQVEQTAYQTVLLPFTPNRMIGESVTGDYLKNQIAVRYRVAKV
jgi:hypothetical protein